MWNYNYTDELLHYGVRGQKWGVRRYQDYNGRLKRGHENRYGEWPPKSRKSLSKAEQRILYKDVKESAKDGQAASLHTNNTADLGKKYRGLIREPEKFSAKTWYDAIELDTHDYTKGSPEWVSKQNAIKYAEQYLGKYADKPIKTLTYKTTAKEYLADVIDTRGVDRALTKQMKNRS